MGGRTHFGALAGGAVAVMAVAVMIVAMTPRTSSGPVALSATTTPMLVRNPDDTTPTAAAMVPTASGTVRTLQVRPGTNALVSSFAAFPHAVTPGPQLDVDGTPIADHLPGADDIVWVRTDAVTYRLPWDDAELMVAPDGSVVFDLDGELVAYVRQGELISLVGD